MFRASAIMARRGPKGTPLSDSLVERAKEPVRSVSLRRFGRSRHPCIDAPVASQLDCLLTSFTVRAIVNACYGSPTDCKRIGATSVRKTWREMRVARAESSEVMLLRRCTSAGRPFGGAAFSSLAWR